MCSSFKAHFWHVADFHLDKNFTSSSNKNKENRDYFLGSYRYDICWEDGGAGEFGDFDCDAPVRLIQTAVDFIRDFEPEDGNEIKFVLWTG